MSSINFLDIRSGIRTGTETQLWAGWPNVHILRTDFYYTNIELQIINELHPVQGQGHTSTYLIPKKKYKDKSKKSHVTFHNNNKSHSAQIYIKKTNEKKSNATKIWPQGKLKKKYHCSVLISNDTNISIDILIW